MFNFGRKHRDPRRSTRQQAWISQETGFATRPCTVLDISERGARLRIEDAAFIQPTVRLKLTPSSSGRRCRVAWRKDNELGVEYLPADKPMY